MSTFAYKICIIYEDNIFAARPAANRGLHDVLSPGVSISLIAKITCACYVIIYYLRKNVIWLYSFLVIIYAFLTLTIFYSLYNANDIPFYSDPK